MFASMKTTLDLSEALVVAAKALAARQHTTLTQLVEEGLHLRLKEQGTRKKKVRLPVYAGRGGLQPGVDGLSNASLLRAVDDDDA